MKKVLNYIILICSLGLTGWILIHNNDFSQFPTLIGKIDKGFLFLAFLSMIFYWIFDGYILYRMKKTLSIEGSFVSSFRLAMIGQYYSALTPFATGGQPAQVYSLSQDKVPVGKSSSLMITKLLTYQIIVTFYSIFMFIIKFNFLLTKSRGAFPFVLTGCLLNFIFLLIIIGSIYNEKLIRNIFSRIFIFGYRLKLIKDVEKLEDRLNLNLMDYGNSGETMRQDKKTAIILILLTFIQLTFYFSITYFVYLAVGLRKASYLDIIAIQSLHYMAVSFMPTPGTVGAAEGGFYMLYNSIFPGSVLTFAMLLWRFIDYYFTIIIGGLVTLIDYIYRKNKEKRYKVMS